MSFPVTPAYPLAPPVQIGFEEGGGLSVTIPGPPPVQIPEEGEPSVTIPSGPVIPPLCIGLGGDGSIIVSIPSGVNISMPLGQIEGIILNGVVINPRVIIKFPNGGTITLPRRIVGPSHEARRLHVKVDGLNVSMDPLP